MFKATFCYESKQYKYRSIKLIEFTRLKDLASKMKILSVFVFCVATVAVFAGNFTIEEKKAKIAAFVKCIACGDQQAQDEYMKCDELKPQKCKEIADTCKKQVMPDIDDVAGRWNHICQYPGTTTKILDCIMTDENKKLITPEDKEELHKFKECVKEIAKAHCHNEDS